MKQLPRWNIYCQNTTGINALLFYIGELNVWYSYKAPVAFQKGFGTKLVVRENHWGPTTGKHLNAIDGGDKSTRVDSETFEKLLQEALEE